MTPESSSCPNCGQPLGESAPMGLCPECLLKAGFGTVTDEGQGKTGAGAFVPPSPEELRARFPQLEILELLGRGGMGAVYKARQKALDRWVALKILPPSLGDAPSFAARFAQEAKALAQLHHPHIVTLYEFGEADGLFYFLMEFVDGVNLRQLLHTGRLLPAEALAIVPQICEALQFAHDRGIVHRDIKPENILLNKDGQVKIADFGVAKIVERGLAEAADSGEAASDPLQTEAGKVIGTPQYMAPEQVSAPLEVDHRADIYALGVVFYQMLTGELPAARLEPPSRKVVLDVRLDEVVLRALEKEPARRYQQASVLGTQVETIAGTPTEPAPVSVERELFHLSGITKFRSVVAFRFALLSCLGFLGFLGNIPNWERMFGMFGFFGFSGVAYLIETFTRFRDGRSAGGSQPPTVKTSVSPRLSRTALAGACAAVLPFVIGVMGPALTGPVRYDDRPMHFVVVACQLTALALACSATALGWVAVARIRRSAGQLYGLGLAVSDGLFYPLLALDAAVLGVVSAMLHAWMALTKQTPAMVEWLPRIIVPIIIVICVAADFFIIRAVWRAVNRRPDGTASAGWKWALGVAGAVGMLVCLFVAVFTVRVVSPVTGPAEAVNFHYRIFEMDAAAVDEIIPLAARQLGVMPGLRAFANEAVVSLGDPRTPPDTVFSDAQCAEVSADGVASLLAKSGPLLAEQSRLIYNWPATADTWAYSKADGTMLGGGLGSGFLGARRVQGVLKVRLEYRLTHSINALSERPGKQWQSQILYEGQAARPGHALVFLVPFSRPQGVAKYLVIAFDTESAPTARWPSESLLLLFSRGHRVSASMLITLLLFKIERV